MDFKRNILDVTLMQRNQWINLCPEKCRLGKISICCQKMCYLELNYSQVSSSTSFSLELKFKLQPKVAIFWQNAFFSKSHQFVHFCSRDLIWVLVKAYWHHLLGEVLRNWLACQIQNIGEFQWEKKGLTLTFTGSNEAQSMI